RAARELLGPAGGPRRADALPLRVAGEHDARVERALLAEGGGVARERERRRPDRDGRRGAEEIAASRAVRCGHQSKSSTCQAPPSRRRRTRCPPGTSTTATSPVTCTSSPSGR